MAALLGVVSVLCAGGSAIAYVLYDKATTPDRSIPVVTVRNYVDSYLGDRDDKQAAAFTCADQSGLADFKALRQDLESRERTYHFTITVSVDNVTETSRSGDTAHALASILIKTTDNGRPLRRFEKWDFEVRRDDDWRVCGARKVG